MSIKRINRVNKQIRSTSYFVVLSVLLGLLIIPLLSIQCSTPKPPPVKLDSAKAKNIAPPPPPPPPPAKNKKVDPAMPVMVEEEEDIDIGVLEGVEGSVDGGVFGGIVGADQSSACYSAPPPPPEPVKHNTEEFAHFEENSFLKVLDNPLSTFSIDVDTGSYSIVRRALVQHKHPYKDAVRIEELLNYFTYDYPEPRKNHPFSITTETGVCPWNQEHRLLHIGIKGKQLKSKKTPPSNLVFLLDVSGSMSGYDKLPLLKRCFKLLVNGLTGEDRVAIVVYAGAAGLVLPSTSGENKQRIIDALHALDAGGSTAGGAGIRLAYQIARDNFLPDGNNRVILATDGDFNVGVSSTSEMIRMIEEKRKSGIFLTTLGFGMGNYKDNRLEQMADKGNGSYHYIDNFMEGKKVFVHQMKGTLFTIAKDVKIQVEFNPAKVLSYRLVGYENRGLRKEDFDDDTKDAGELGAGHTVTALYEIIPRDTTQSAPSSAALKFQETRIKVDAINSKNMAFVKLRFKEPNGTVSKLIQRSVKWNSNHRTIKNLPQNIRFSSAVAMFGMLLRKSEYAGKADYNQVLELAGNALGEDRFGYRAEFLRLVQIAKQL
jgi:Ca-activated chloride channel homolog